MAEAATRWLLLPLLFAAGPHLWAAPVPKVEGKKGPTTKEEFAALAKEGPKPPWLPFGPGHNRVAKEYVRGTVAEVGEDFVEVVPPGQTDAVRYPAYTLLQTGAVCHWEIDNNCYLLPDVKKGDEVFLGVGTVDKEKGVECFYVSIRRRPGAGVPESRKPSELRPYHKLQQEQNEYDDRGEHTPAELKGHEALKEFHRDRGLPPPPPLKPKVPRLKQDEPPVKKD